MFYCTVAIHNSANYMSTYLYVSILKPAGTDRSSGGFARRQFWNAMTTARMKKASLGNVHWLSLCESLSSMYIYMYVVRVIDRVYFTAI
jgi:hypothetical protein